MVRAHDLTVSAALVLLAGCSLAYSDDLAKKQCTEPADCEPYARELGTPLVCRSNACQAPYCSSSKDCGPGVSCVEGQCIAPRRDGGTSEPIRCTQDADCASGSRCGFDQRCYVKWGCLDQSLDWPTSSSAGFSFRMEASWIGLRDPSIIPDMLVRACPSFSPACDLPVVSSARHVQNGVLEVPFMQPFTGTIQLAAAVTGFSDGGVPPADAGAAALPMPTFIHFTAINPLASEQYAQSRLILLPAAVFKAYEAEFQRRDYPLVFDEKKSVVALQVHDCGGRPAPGVSMIPTYTNSYTFVPVQGETEPVVGGTSTGSDGTAILINLEPGYGYFTLRDEGAQRQINDAIAFPVQARAVNYLLYYPRHSALQQWLAVARTRGLSPEAP